MKAHLGTTALLLAILMTAAAIAQPGTDWLRTYGGEDLDFFNDVCQTADGGFLITYTTGFGDGCDLIKTNSLGDVDWTRGYDSDVLRYCVRARQATDGGYFLAGAVSGEDRRDDVVLQKIAANGDLQWRFVVGDYWGPEVAWVEPTPDGGCIAGGSVFWIGGASTALVFKVDADGNSEWVQTYGGSNYDGCSVILNAPGGGYFMVGTHYFVGENPADRLWVMKLDANGDSVWNQMYSFPYRPEFGSAHVTPDGGLAVAGIYYEARQLDWYIGSRVLVRLSPEGDSLWTRTYMTDECITCTSLDCTSDGGFVMAGDGGVLRVNALGDSLWWLDHASALCLQTTDNGYLLAGTTNSESSDIFLLKTLPEPTAADLPEVVLPGSIVLQPNFPNPFNATTTIHFDLLRDSPIELAVFDINGRHVQTLISGQYPAGSHEVHMDAGDLTSGVYLCRLTADRFSATQKMVLLK